MYCASTQHVKAHLARSNTWCRVYSVSEVKEGTINKRDRVELQKEQRMHHEVQVIVYA